MGEPLTAQRVGLFHLRLDRHTHASRGCVPQKTEMEKLNAFGRERDSGSPDSDLAVKCRQCRPSEMLIRSMDRLAVRVAVDGAIDIRRWHPLGDLFSTPRHPPRARPMVAAHEAEAQKMSCTRTRVCKDV